MKQQKAQRSAAAAERRFSARSEFSTTRQGATINPQPSAEAAAPTFEGRGPADIARDDHEASIAAISFFGAMSR